MFGGSLHYKLTTYTGSTIQLEEDDWISSLQEFRHWDIIEFRNPVNIIEFLPNDLKNEIRELIGKTIIYSNIQYNDFKIHDYNDKSNIVDLKARNIVDLKTRTIDSIFQIMTLIRNPEHFYLQSTSRHCNHNDDTSHDEVLNIRTECSTILFGIPVVLKWNPSFKHSIIGHHFSSNDDEVDICLYKYDRPVFII
ncbi:hypothetical protein C2G38_2239006 [Gigaspora rosea]|uniref:DUF7431 domain-containing protein n=1 Tax=Gigaspora rosea TaxID=44941 RepID=A0A397W7L4_9GLOM|nr:hypothetical protein C2G38_2239006 [Gigaspora rosea]